MAIVRIFPQNIQISIQPEQTLLAACHQAGLMLESYCGAHGSCGKCRVRILQGKVNAPQEEELSFFSPQELDKGWRLACLLRVDEDISIWLPLKEEGCPLKEPKTEKINYAKGGASLSLGLALDIGTTTIGAILADLETGREIGSLALANPQLVFGQDLINRLEYGQKNIDGFMEMQKAVVSAINQIISEFERCYKIKRKNIIAATVVGNTVMSHILAGADCLPLTAMPFSSPFKGGEEFSGEEIGLDISPKAKIYFLPHIGGFVGSDTVAMLLNLNIHEAKGLELAVDIGTNSEVVLAYNGKLLACSAAAGPAFEGANILHGMRGLPGAIEEVKISPDGVEIGVIGDSKPLGICGSGILDAVAQFLQNGIINSRGRFWEQQSNNGFILPPALKSRLRYGLHGREFVLEYAKNGAKSGVKDEIEDRDIVITQKDIRQLQSAKAAIYAGIIMLLNEAGAKIEDLDKVYLAGAFGNYIKKESALAVGLLPKIEAEKIVSIGNGAGKGAFLSLVDEEKRKLSQALAQSIRHIELFGRRDFEEAFLQAIDFPT